MMPSPLEAAKGAFSCPAVSKLRGMASADRNDPQRRKEAYAAVIELRAFMDSQFQASMFATILSAARIKDRKLPSHQEWVNGWTKIKNKMETDRKFVAELCDKLPDVLAKYSLSNAVQIFNDPVIRELAEWGLK